MQSSDLGRGSAELVEQPEATFVLWVGQAGHHVFCAVLLRAPKHLHVETSWNNMRRMMKHTSVPFAVLPEDPKLYADLARIYHHRSWKRADGLRWWPLHGLGCIAVHAV